MEPGVSRPERPRPAHPLMAVVDPRTETRQRIGRDRAPNLVAAAPAPARQPEHAPDDEELVGLVGPARDVPEELLRVQTHARARHPVRIEALTTVGADIVALVAAMCAGLVALALVSGAQANELANLERNIWFDLPFPVVTLGLFAVYGLYRQRRRRFRPRGFHDMGRFFHAVAAGALVTLGVGATIHRLTGRPEMASAQLFAIALATLVLVPLGRGGAHLLLRAHPSARTRVLIVGTGVVAELVRQHCAEDRGVEVVGMVDDDPAPGSDVLGTIDEVERLCDDLAIDRVLVTFSRSHPSGTVNKLRDLHMSVPISVVPRYFEIMSYRSQVDEIDGLPIIDVAPGRIGPGARFAKRSLDIVGSVVGLLILAPVIAALCVAIKISSKGPVFFGQVRIGRDGRAFKIWKFRTMRFGAQFQRHILGTPHPSGALLSKPESDPRVFPLGALLRRTSFDEVPQLFNVLRGDMSLVGPRPIVAEECDAFDDWASRRYEMRPGVTGLWQVSGRCALNREQRQQLDYLYVASWSILWDLRILWKTPAAVLRGRGAY